MKFLAPTLLFSLGASAVALPSDNNSSADVGKKILDTALTAKDTPYAWGGGSCKGPTGDQPPYNYGETGYDCSGLVCWAVCKVTGRDLFSEGLRVTSSMYCASEKKLGYKYEITHSNEQIQWLTHSRTGNTPTPSAKLVTLSSSVASAIAMTPRVSITLVL